VKRVKFKFLVIEITIRKDYIIIGIILLIVILILWGWYLKTNQAMVFDAGNGRPVNQGESHGENNDRKEESKAKDEIKKAPEEPLFININTADIDTLVKLPGIGEVKAKAVIQYREQNGPFKSIEEIKNVKGIGEATFLKIKDRIRVGTEGRRPCNPDLLK